jgi:hypothetical protein
MRAPTGPHGFTRSTAYLRGKIFMPDLIAIALASLLGTMPNLATDTDPAPEADPALPSTTEADPLILEDESRWQLQLTPYLWIPAQNGTVGVRGRSSSVDFDIGDTFDTISDNFNFAAAMHAELSRDRLTLFGDVMYLSLEADNTTTPAGSADIRMDQGIFELGFAYAAIHTQRSTEQRGLTLEPLTGIRVQYLSLEIDPDAADSASASQTWIDGFVGARANIDLTSRIALRLRGDIGMGDSDLTWNALAGIDLTLSQRTALQLGYRALGTDYTDGSGTSRFEYDMILHGPYAALTISF